jgi:transcription elongation factor GreA
MRVPIRKGGKYTHDKPDPRLTAGKLKQLKKKLKRLKELDRLPLMKEVERLAHDGDFSENAGYQAAKGKLRGINQRIIDLEDHIGSAIVIKLSDATDCVELGRRVTLDNNGQEVSYLILGSSETNPDKGVISDHSPVGKALIGKYIGESVMIKINNQNCECKIVRVE